MRLFGEWFYGASPEYHGGVSGALKNALDLMSFEELSGKVVGAMSVLGGQANSNALNELANSNALNELRTIARWVHAWVIPEQIAIGQAWKAFNEDGQLLDKKLDQRLEQFVQSLIEKTQKLRQ
ncbi:MAG: NAD(P)H-dependent oxidoreductase [Leptolyngbya sp. SIO1E4]|nr:NAD(P)H-dependent oxidoreductase [Leptolyngbya sp. SIO1E4]